MDNGLWRRGGGWRMIQQSNYYIGGDDVDIYEGRWNSTTERLDLQNGKTLYDIYTSWRDGKLVILAEYINGSPGYFPKYKYYYLSLEGTSTLPQQTVKYSIRFSGEPGISDDVLSITRYQFNDVTIADMQTTTYLTKSVITLGGGGVDLSLIDNWDSFVYRDVNYQMQTLVAGDAIKGTLTIAKTSIVDANQNDASGRALVFRRLNIAAIDAHLNSVDLDITISGYSDINDEIKIYYIATNNTSTDVEFVLYRAYFFSPKAGSGGGGGGDGVVYVTAALASDPEDPEYPEVELSASGNDILGYIADGKEVIIQYDNDNRYFHLTGYASNFASFVDVMIDAMRVSPYSPYIKMSGINVWDTDDLIGEYYERDFPISSGDETFNVRVDYDYDASNISSNKTFVSLVDAYKQGKTLTCDFVIDYGNDDIRSYKTISLQTALVCGDPDDYESYSFMFGILVENDSGYLVYREIRIIWDNILPNGDIIYGEYQLVSGR